MSEASEDQSPRGGMRQVQRRNSVFEDVRPYPVADAYSSADLEADRADVTWGNPVDVRGRDVITLFIDFTKVTGQTDLYLGVQLSWSDSKDDEVWYDRHVSANVEDGEDPDVPVLPTDPHLDITGFDDGPNRVAIALKVRSSFMRFAPYGGGTVVGSRDTVRAQRILFAT